MKSTARFLSSSITILALGLAAPLTAGIPDTPTGKNAKAVTIQDMWSLPGILGGGLKTTDEYTEGNVFLVVPVYSTIGRDGRLGGDVLFIEPYSSWGEQGEVAASLGMGWRHLISDQSVSAITRHDGHQAGFFEEGVFVGANFFVDMLDTEFDNQFWQLGFGVEVGTRYLEARANYYLPLTDRKLARETRTTQTFTNSHTSTSQHVTPLNDPYATGNTIAQDANFSTVATTTTTTTTIENLFRLYEEGMEGWDVEVALLVPGLDRYMDVKVVGGYYSFDNAPLGPQTGGTGNVEGWKAGLEVRPVPAVILTTTWYEDERFVGSEWLYGIRMEIPFEMGHLADGRGGFWGRIKDAFTPRRRHLAERMVEPVRRQNEAIQVGNEVEQEQSVSTDVKRVTKVVSQGPRHLILKDDIIFVNHGEAVGNGIQAGSAAGDGTAEHPVDKIEAGGELAQANSITTQRIWNVYTQGNGTPYVQDVLVSTASVNFISSGQPLHGVGGKTFGAGPAPVLDGGFLVDGTGNPALAFFGITGYTITGGLQGLGEGGLVVYNVANVLVQSNTFLDIGRAQKGAPASVQLYTDGSNSMTALVTGNTLADSEFPGHLFLAESEDTSTMNLTMTGNSFVNASVDSIHAEARSGSTMTLAVNNNDFNGATEDYIDAQAFDSATLHFSASGNAMHSEDDAAIRLVAWDDSIFTFAINGNSMENGGDAAIVLQSLGDTSSLVGTITNNYISNFTFRGIDISSTGAASVLNVQAFDGNTIVNMDHAGFAIRLQVNSFIDGSTLFFNGTQNNIVGPTNGVLLHTTSNPAGTFPAGSFYMNGVLITLPEH